MDDKSLVEAAFQALKTAYAPYSGFSVGAALRSGDGRVFLGCNVENAAGMSICAERTALVKAVSEGCREFSAIAVAAASPFFCTPCGVCRQMLYEFSPSMRVLCAKDGGEWEEYLLSELLPHAFSASSPV